MDINDLSIALAKASPKAKPDELNKAIPPKLYYRLYSWLKQMKSVKRPGKEHSQVQQVLTEKTEEMIAMKALKKNEMMASVYEHGVMKLDFGSDVPEKVKKAALNWAKRKGLKPVEASLSKSVSIAESVVCVTDNAADAGECLKRFKWSF